MMTPMGGVRTKMLMAPLREVMTTTLTTLFETWTLVPLQMTTTPMTFYEARHLVPMQQPGSARGLFRNQQGAGLPASHCSQIKTEYWDRAGEVVPMLLYVLWRRKIHSGLQLGVGGWRLRVPCMWLCVLYSPPLFLYWLLAFASPRSHYSMNVTVCFVFPSLLLSLQMAFASPRSHYRMNVTVCFVPPPFMCLQMAFASPRFHYRMNVTVCFVFLSPFTCLQMAFASPRSHYRMNVTVCFVLPSPFLCLQMAFASPRSHSFLIA